MAKIITLKINFSKLRLLNKDIQQYEELLMYKNCQTSLRAVVSVAF